jgi:hypothetical protein
MHTIGAALVCSGGLGNLIDRIGRHGYVTDFLNAGIGPVRTGIFNVADFALMLGISVLFISGSVIKRSVPVALLAPYAPRSFVTGCRLNDVTDLRPVAAGLSP